MVLRLLNFAAKRSVEFLPVTKEDVKPLVETVVSTEATPTIPEEPAAMSGATTTSETTSTSGEEGTNSPAVLLLSPSSAANVAEEPFVKPRMEKRFSWRSLVGAQDRKIAPPTSREELEVKLVAHQEYIQRQVLRSRADKRARDSALVVREMIVGPFAAPSAALPKNSKVAASALPPMHKVQKAKAQLLEPRAAKRLIAQLRQMPSSDVPVVVGKTSTGEDVKALPKGPIHAVCLPFTDSEAHEKAFSKLDKVPVSTPSPSASPKMKERSVVDLSSVTAQTVETITSVTTSSFEKIKEILSELNVVSLITTPDLGLGQPGDGPGLLSGAIPTAKAVVEGVEELTPQLMAIGYATGKSILPSHAGIYPPTDRMSVLTYWWGLEVVMPEPSVQYLSNVPSIAHTVVNFLTALSVANGGVRELMPFVRYISQYIDAEFNSIRGQDEGQGVVCAATWIMPAALVPRPWDFAPPPSTSTPTDGEKDATPTPAPANPPPASGNAELGPIMLTPSLPSPSHAPLFSSSAAVSSKPAANVAGNAAQGVPGVTVTPPTPPASETLGKVAGTTLTSNAPDAAGENGSAAFGTMGANSGLVNGTPLVVA